MNRITHFYSIEQNVWISRIDYHLLGISMFFNRLRENIPMWVAKALPHKVVLWCFILVMGKASSCSKCGGDKRHVDTISYKEAYNCWEHCK